MRDSDISKLVAELQLIEKWNDKFGSGLPNEYSTGGSMRHNEIRKMLKESVHLPEDAHLVLVAAA